jgi:hypothetical protein
MARKSLSSQVIEELDRARGLLRPVQDIVDPMTSHMVGAVLDSLNLIEGMCLRARQADANVVLADPEAPPVMTRAPKTAAPSKARTTSHRAPRGRKEA